ncbi:MAG: maltose transport system permease protein [Thermoanaerobacteraceae bacterium]|jgi:raffinose/stachyose/melibiose transport system permease protein|uniref:ABC transporter permease subunit n=1 Tax=Biomaibacter acetigenes TaxID=2316383 RepID=A0A3G2R3D9_9FIRM|nr:carbohydrate ABC transporter permease [Biomaibacter acetigenes]MDK2878617.1 maltose transport system permease protein [Thermoanaerobacteraceae bacterium]RKL61725.1 carbohydrate ABC transporter permease [Thermoanaerobacteraceae bacterium SP2]AYO29457.1 ABC transporter permease subunit [Biomaibacter acetigenes]MDN5302354.1 maltose transport system permease protein [Thermoanaerobacteraceae bacterium]MDN5311874.1 maltose transport system permease protein [Thermoanaerobacteraceae bacterium]
MTRKTGQAFLAAIGLILGIIWMFPFYIVLINSFKTQRDIFINTMGLPSKWVIDNYITAAEKLNIATTFFNSLIITVASVAVICTFSSMAAYALERVKSKSSTVLFLVFATAMLIPFQTVMLPLVAEFGRVHMLNRIGLVFMYLGFGSPLAIFLYHGALKSIPRSLDEAAIIDGCSRFQAFWMIIFPSLKPTTVTVAILNIIWIWNDYLLPSLVINKKGMETLPIMIFYFFGQYTKQWHLAMAGLTMVIIPVIIFYFLAQKEIIKGITAGAVKQ